MASVATAPVHAPPSESAGFSSAWARLLAPSYIDFFLVALLVWLFASGDGWKGLLLDGDTGWHIRTGDYIRATGGVPKIDLFSYSKAGAPWFAWEWLTDLLYAVVHGTFGLAGVAALSGIVICTTATVLLRQALMLGANSFVALAATMMFVGAGTIHFHARPHVFTLLFLAVFTYVLVRDRIQPHKSLWVLIPLVALWTNMHGGFLAAVGFAGLTAAGTAVQCLFGCERNWRIPARYTLLTGGCAAASLLNPYGIRLHQHVAEYLRSDFIRSVVQEFRSPEFRSESALYYEIVLVTGLLATGLLLSRRCFPEAFVVIYFAHMSLTSVRHVPLYAIVASPLVAVEITRMWSAWVQSKSRRSLAGILDQIAIDFGAGFKRVTIWSPAGVVFVLLLTPAENWPADFQHNFPTKMVAKYGDTIASSRVLSTDQWGDYLIYRLYPRQRVFVDGRSDFYGEALGKDYIALVNANYRWESILQRYGFNLILAPVNWPLTSVLKLSPNWRLVADDGYAVMFSPVANTSTEKSQNQDLMSGNVTAEGTRRDPANQR
jgi:hypothetical protein